MDVAVYNQQGKEVEKIKLPEKVFGVKWNPDLVHQVVVSMQANARQPIAHTKDRSEVRGGGRKPWRQKGTGRARHGSNRSPIWRGGGATFGPRRESNYTKKINKKMRLAALHSVLSRKAEDGELVFVDSLSFPAPKTKEAKEVLASLASIKTLQGLTRKRKNAALIALPQKDENTDRSFRNIAGIAVEEVRNLNPLQLLTHKYLVIASPREAVAFWEKKAGEKERHANSHSGSDSKDVAKEGTAKKTARKMATK